MAQEDRKTGKLATVYIDIFDASHGAAQRIKILDTFDWELTADVQLEDVTVKNEVSTRHKVIGITNSWRAQRYLQAPAVFSREVLNYLNNPGTLLAAAGTAAGVDSGAATDTGALFGGEKSANAFGSGTAANLRPPVAFALYVLDNAADNPQGLPVDDIADASAVQFSAIYSGQGYLVRGNISVPREGLITETIEVVVDGPLTYAEQA